MTAKRIGNVCILIGFLLFLTSALLVYSNLAEEKNAEEASNAVIVKLNEMVSAADTTSEKAEGSTHASDRPDVIADYKLYPQMEMPIVRIDGHDYIGTVSIPRLGLDLPVMSTWSYDNLKIAPCRFSGSAYLGNLIVCAHNYSCHFRQIGTLDANDEVIIMDAERNTFVYSVAERETLQPDQLAELQDGDWDLTLFTCTLGGKTRIVIRCVRCG